VGRREQFDHILCRSCIPHQKWHGKTKKAWLTLASIYVKGNAGMDDLETG
jgi:hypothetical protein